MNSGDGDPSRANCAALCQLGLLLAVIILLPISGCTNQPQSTEELVVVNCTATDSALVIPANRQWVTTNFDVQAGEVVTVVGSGRIDVGPQQDHWMSARAQVDREVGPEGTYRYADEVLNQPFPLPSAARGPAPCFSLIGRIGDGPAFFIGQRKSWVAQQSGPLLLGINDYKVNDNTGQFFAKIEKPTQVQPLSFENVVKTDAASGQPIAGSSVVVFYVDGLRPDVVREMAAMGHIPNIRKLFVDGGAWMSNTFTAFPSDTITSNGTMWTGCFSDRHGLKGQVRFSRRTLASESYLDPLGPNRSARLLKPQGIDKLIREVHAGTLRSIRGEESSDEWRKQTSSDIAPVFQHLRSNGSDWATGVLPMMTDVPPTLWTRSMVRNMPYLRSQEAWKYIDDANTHFAIRHLLQDNRPITIIWLPETDSVSHKLSRGQFGVTRRTIVNADELLGRIVAEIGAQGRLDSTYFFLVSDHGHHGGRDGHLVHFDIANQLLFKPREVTTDGNWTGGGLGLSVRQHRSWNRHKGDSSRQFVFIDGDSDGAARVFLPKGHYHSNNWDGPNRPGDLLAYQVAPNQPAVNLIDTLTAATTYHGDGTIQRPTDLVLAKLNDHSILISTHDRGRAVVDRKRDDAGGWLYKYLPVTDVRPTAEGEVAFRAVENPRTDPLRLCEFIRSEHFNYYHSEREWLLATAKTPYPDSVVTLTRHMLWQENLQAREREFAPDLVVTARAGWYFGTGSSPGTMHGYPLADSMRASWFVSGPNIRRGARIESPCRLVDLTPTMLELVGVAPEEDSEFDGVAIRNFYQTSGTTEAETAPSQAVFWNDVDLHAWQPLNYQPVPEYEHLPFTINRPSSFFDLNNMAYNALTISDLNVFRLFDDVISPLSRGREYVTPAVERAEQNIRHSNQKWLAEGAETLDVAGLSVGDYSTTSLGNLKRIDRAVDWVQSRGQQLDARVAEPLGRRQTPGTPQVNRAIDGTQTAFWEIYRFAQRVVIELLDENVLNGVENTTDRAVNSFRRLPAETIVPAPAPSTDQSPPGPIAQLPARSATK